jgi:hypothetical protein
MFQKRELMKRHGREKEEGIVFEKVKNEKISKKVVIFFVNFNLIGLFYLSLRLMRIFILTNNCLCFVLILINYLFE